MTRLSLNWTETTNYCEFSVIVQIYIQTDCRFSAIVASSFVLTAETHQQRRQEALKTCNRKQKSSSSAWLTGCARAERHCHDMITSATSRHAARPQRVAAVAIARAEED
ncbi:uncharacterized protein PHALS_11236 [Plasmopara halstedii]|uniref:Uncharacterized protein n=1 Tax=Plasmopara halstedii TaxID=4781 RepID=A0A0N7L5C2_PLAHL|nr:uncharacterized protein PHALS_11236 [Plasmopara halstedii]CEG41067.1 hypothetical protein PHALS_11236 [Plasmopara halstedii]|eukprot:XP_024577436.1 hypothetical protein PHALS_11236 [Plasmopara halstedii]